MACAKPNILTRMGYAARLFRRHKGGATAIEFAMIAPVFFFMLFAIMDLGLAYFATSVLENATQDMSRMIMVGRANNENWTADTFRTTMCPRINVLMDCSKVTVDVRSFASFAQVNAPLPTGTPSAPQFNNGQSNTIMVVRVTYPWPNFVPNFDLGVGTPDANGTRTLQATTAFRNEPF